MKVLVQFAYKRVFGLMRQEYVTDSVMLEAVEKATEVEPDFFEYVLKRLKRNQELRGDKEVDFEIIGWLSESGRAKW